MQRNTIHATFARKRMHPIILMSVPMKGMKPRIKPTIHNAVVKTLSTND